jgi:molybdenum cofactor synthesis domain-containing protein
MIRYAILTISDRSSRGARPDLSGPALAEAVQLLDGKVTESDLVPDEQDQIAALLRRWCDEDLADVILTTGGTGFALRDVTPEATLQVIERSAPGLVEAMRWNSIQITPHAMLSRAQAGIRRRTIIINLPGSPKGAVENFEMVATVLPHAVELLRSDIIPDSHHKTKK